MRMEHPRSDAAPDLEGEWQRALDGVRLPLWAVRVAAGLLASSPRLSPKEAEVVQCMLEDAARAEASMRLLLHPALGSTGSSVTTERRRCDLRAISEEALASVRGRRGGRPYRFAPAGEVGEWDRVAIVEVLIRMLEHADDYGAFGAGVDLVWRSAPEHVEAIVTVAPALRGASVVGLRLAVARELAANHGGRLTALHEASGRLTIVATFPRGR